MSKATEILTKLRDTYVKRITDFLIENEQELLNRADGDGYFSVDELFEAGEELRQISVILGSMPSDPTPNYQQPETIQIVTVQPVNFALWAEQIRAGNYDGAVASMSYLFNIDTPLASRCTNHFLNLLGRDQRAFAMVQQIRYEVQQGRLEGCLDLLNECFGLQPAEAVHVATHLKL